MRWPGYGCARTYAELLGDRQGARLRQTTLKEKEATDKKLTRLAKELINVKAKKALPQPERSEGGMTGTIKRVIQKVTGNDSPAERNRRRRRGRAPLRFYA